MMQEVERKQVLLYSPLSYINRDAGLESLISELVDVYGYNPVYFSSYAEATRLVRDKLDLAAMAIFCSRSDVSRVALEAARCCMQPLSCGVPRMLVSVKRREELEREVKGLDLVFDGIVCNTPGIQEFSDNFNSLLQA